MPRLNAAAGRVAAALLVAGLLAGVSSPAAAHAEIVEADPAPNASLVEAPERLTITFSEPIDSGNTAIDLVDAQLRPIEGLGPVEVLGDGRTATVRLPDLAPDAYTVRYRVVSTVDGHATEGFYAFLIDPSGAAPPPTDSASESSPSVDPFTVVARWLGLVSFLVAFGSVVMWWHAGAVGSPTGERQPPPWILVAAAGLAAAAGVAGYLLLAGRPVAGAGTGIPLDVAGPFGWTSFAIAVRVAVLSGALAAAVALAGALRRVTALGPVLLVGAVLAVGLAAMSVAGHAAAGGPAFAALDWLHLVAAAAWLGGLPAGVVLALRLAPDAPGRRRALGEILRRHGRLALLAAPVVALTGIANSPIVLGTSRDLVASDYGNLLVAKAVLLSVAVGIGAVNHLALRGRGRAAVAVLLGAELAVAVVAVAAAATMVTIQPAAARRPEPAAVTVNPAHLFGEVGPLRAHLTVSLPAPGSQSYRVLLVDASTGIPRDDVEEVFVELTAPEGTGLEPLRVELVPEPDPSSGLYVASGDYTPVEGEWSLALVVRRSGERDHTIGFDLPVRAIPPPELGPPEDTGVGVPAPLAAAWSLVPGGPAAWLPAFLSLAALALAGRLPATRARGFARGAALVVLVVGFGAAGTRALVAAANEPTAQELAQLPAATSPGDAARGEAIYRANCASCHGLRGDGDGPLATLPQAGPLDSAVAEASDAELSYRIAYGIAGTPMPAFAGLLTPDERADLIAHLRQQVADD